MGSFLRLGRPLRARARCEERTLAGASFVGARPIIFEAQESIFELSRTPSPLLLDLLSSFVR